MIKKYVEKPIEVEAIQWTGDNTKEIQMFTKGHLFECEHNNKLLIITLEGDIHANIGDYIIKGINGEFYPCKADFFKKTYEEIK